MSVFTVDLELPHPPATLFAFLAEPRNRPLWQSSLRKVVDVDAGEPRVGMRWRDVTRPGFRPLMELTELVPDRVVTEVGTWRGVRGVLTLRFAPSSRGTRLTAEVGLTGRGVYAVAAAVSGLLAPSAIRKDLLRASQLLARGGADA